MGALRRFFARFRARRVVGEVLKEMETKKPEEFFESMQAPQEVETPTQEQFTVTGQYQIVAAEVKKAVEEKKKARSAAQRLMDAIGVAPKLKDKR